MNNKKYRTRRITIGLLFLALACSPLLTAQGRFQVELYGGISFLKLGDLNLLSKAEEQYNFTFFIQRLLGYEGYFTNDFPRISDVVPAGFRAKYRLSETFALSLDLEGFRRTREVSFSGTFSYSPSWTEVETREYDPFRLTLRGISVMGGLHYLFRAGRPTEIEVGAAAGWTRAEFNFRSAWTMTIDLISGGFYHSSLDGGALEGDGTGRGPAAKAMVRLNQALGRRFGFFVETAAMYCRLKSIRGGGRETRLGIPGETTWEGTWGIKKEEIEMSWGSAAVSVPTNYWGGWTEAQRERDFILDLSGLRLVVGIFFRL
jgi:hypothetical protein